MKREPTEEAEERDLGALPEVEKQEGVGEVVLDPRGFPIGQFKLTREPIVGKVSKKSPLYVRMMTLGRGVQDFVVDEVTTRGVEIKPPWTKTTQLYRIGERGKSYDVFVHRAYGTRHATVYEGLSTPPVHLTEGRWEDTDPSTDAAFVKLLAAYEGAAKLLNIEEPIPVYVWILAAVAILPWVVRFVELFV